MRSKEEAHDYRYFPDPDLLPLELSADEVAAIESQAARTAGREEGALHARFALSAYDAGVLVAERETADYYEALAKGRDAKAAANWLNNEFFGRLNKRAGRLPPAPVTAARQRHHARLIADETISGKIAKDLLDIVWSEGGDPRAIVEQRGMNQVTDTGAIEKVDRRDDRRQSRQGRRGEGKTEGARLVRRSGDEVDGRQSEPAGGQRAVEKETRRLTRDARLCVARTPHAKFSI